MTLSTKRPEDSTGALEKTSPERRAQLRKFISDTATLTPEYLIMNLLSTIVAAYGLLQNSTAVVIGAMIIAMLLGPINGLALALNDSNWTLLRRAGIAESLGAGVVFVAALIIGRIHNNIPVSSEMMARTAPNILDLFIALAGGAAGAYAVMSPRLKTGAVGVAIATALVPPLVTAGLLIARGGGENYRLGLGALVLFLTNLVTIQAAASGVFWFFGLHAPLRDTNKGIIELCRRNGISLTLLVALGAFLAYTFQTSISKTSQDSEIRRNLTALIQLKQQGSSLADLNIQNKKGEIDIYAIIRTPNSVTPEQVYEIQSFLSQTMEQNVNLYIRSIITKEASSEGWLHVPASDPAGAGTDQSTAFPGDEPRIDPEEEPLKNSDIPIKELEQSSNPDRPSNGSKPPSSVTGNGPEPNSE